MRSGSRSAYYQTLLRQGLVGGEHRVAGHTEAPREVACRGEGLKLAYRFGDHWASIEAGRGLTIGLHPDSNPPRAGRKGGMEIGLELEGSIEDAMRTLEAKGVTFHGIVRDGKAGKFAYFEDPDGNPLYLAELTWSANQWVAR